MADTDLHLQSISSHGGEKPDGVSERWGWRWYMTSPCPGSVRLFEPVPPQLVSSLDGRDFLLHVSSPVFVFFHQSSTLTALLATPMFSCCITKTDQTGTKVKTTLLHCPLMVAVNVLSHYHSRGDEDPASLLLVTNGFCLFVCLFVYVCWSNKLSTLSFMFF